MLPHLLSKASVARMLDTSPAVIANLASRGLFPKPSHLGRRAVWHEEDVQAWLDANLRAPSDSDTSGHLVNGGGLTIRPLTNTATEG